MASVLRVKDENGNWISIPAIQGKSAYELALQYGFKGTEAEWLESLPSKDVIVAADNSVARLEEKSAEVQAKAETAKGEVEAEHANALSDIAEAKATMLGEIELAANIVQTTGDSETAVMSQNSTTELFNLHNPIKGTTQSMTFDNGRVSQITHADSDGNVVRTDTFTYMGNVIVETRTLASGESLTITTNTDTLITEVE